MLQRNLRAFTNVLPFLYIIVFIYAAAYMVNRSIRLKYNESTMSSVMSTAVYFYSELNISNNVYRRYIIYII